MKLYLLRHALIPENENGINGSWTDSALSEKGEAQARDLTGVLSRNTYDLFIVSPLQRTQQTIQPYLDTLGNPEVLVDELVIERNLGDLTNTIKGDGKIEKSIRESGLNKIEWRPSSGESIVDVYGRAKTFFEKIKKQYPNKTLLICSHRNFLRCLELVVLHKSIEDFYIEEPPMPAIIKNVELREYEC